MRRIIIDPKRCKGCYLCKSFCPKKAIEISETVNEKGCQPIIVIEELCVACGACYQVCPDYVFKISR